MIAIALVFYFLNRFEMPENNILPSYSNWLGKAVAGDFCAKITWLLADWTQPAFQSTFLGAVFMIVGAIVSMILVNRKKSFCTFGVCNNMGLFWKILASQFISAVIANFLFTKLFDKSADLGNFVPTFIPGASFTPALVLVYGGQWYKVITAGILGGFIGPPLAAFTYINFVEPWGLLGAVAWVTPMIIGGLLCFEVCKYLPWMAKQVSDKAGPIPDSASAGTVSALSLKMDGRWFIKRVFADFSEANFYGSEIAGFMFILGGIISVFLNPANPAYGSRLYFAILSSQILTSAIGIFLYWHRYFELGWYPTFIPVVTLGPGFIWLYGTDLHVLLTGAMIGGVFMPPFGNWISRKLPAHHHGYIGSVTSMFVCCIIFVAVFNYVPGFGIK
jgi:hypothetical protein